MMYEKILEDAQEIKRRLSALGENVNEDAICELLQSCGPNYELEHIINMITENWNPDRQNDLDETGTSITDISSIIDKSEIHGNDKISNLEDFIQEYAETSDASSDYDDRDDYYTATNWDDISVVDTVTRSISSPLEPCDTSSSNHNSEAIAVPPEVEFLEENNNDPNNNLDSVQILQELQNNSPDVYDRRDSSIESCVGFTGKPESPKPGCSKDSHDTFIPHKYSKLHSEAEQINVLLPRFKHDVIYETLRYNCNAKNRIELTLWDLLPDRRPKPQIPSKRKLVDDVYHTDHKKNLAEIPEDDVEITFIQSMEKPHSTCKKHSHTKKHVTDVILVENDTISDASQQSVVPFTKAKLNKIDKSDNNIDTCSVSDKNKLYESTTIMEEPLSPACKKDPHTKKHQTDILVENGMITDASQQGVVPTTKVKLSKTDKSGDNIDTCSVSDKEELDESTIKEKLLPKVDIKNEELQCMVTEDLQVILQKERAGETIQHNYFTAVPLLRPSKLTYISNHKYIPLRPSLVPTPILSPPKFKIPKDRKPISTRLMMVPIQNPGKSAVLKQNTEEDVSLDTPANRRNNQTSDVNIAQSRSFVDLTQENITNSQDKTVLNVKTENTKLSKNNPSHSLQPNSTKNIPILNTIKDVNSSKSEVKDLEPERRDNNTPQVMPSTSKEVNTSATKQLEMLGSLQQSDGKQSQTLLNKTTEWIVPSNSANDLVTIHYISTNTLPRQASTSDFVVENVQQEAGCTIRKEQKNSENNTSDKKVTLSQGALKIYFKLIPMFPCVDTKFIRQLCHEYVKDEDLLTDETVILQALIDYLLNHSQEHPNLKKPEPLPEPDNLDVNEQYVNLLEIFPKADPTYLRGVAEQMYDKPDMIKQFVQSKLENPDYPTREQYLAKKKITEQQKQYTTGFQVTQFLEIFPDPFSYFEDDKRECRFDIHAVDFLKHHFNKIRVNTLLNIYAQYKHNLTLTAKTLETLNPDMKTKRIYPLVQSENIPVLQECAFIQHKAELRAYLNELKEDEEKEFNELKAKNELLECQCCYDNECMPSKCSTCEDGHIFCNSCIAKCTDVKLAEGETHIHCLIDCGSEFHLSVLQYVLPPTKFSILLQKRQEAEVMAAGLEGLVSCPFCHFASIPPQEDKIFKCFNPDCMKESCRLCKEINHLPLKCNETKSDAARLYLEEKMSEALIRKCYRCARTFFKEEGCNKMTCLCGAQMCYICDKPISNYGHFKGQGSMASNLCPLWSDDRRMNAEAVIHVCKETMKQIKEKNPEVEINADALLPKLPPKIRGPHDDIAHANVLPAHANRVARHIP
ncbi:PREDICTED: uncharacterized protein LOC106750780 isoform X3 [Dinoponera quadriceps]|nr:PREDICTED: uncharacterized protein LOC106750780 isoform X3 [Dinoponera quadriceps]XP_014486837.1 PREDICTED: uncharacterized protein LOC106750780 isoform X3 [Dinoponera quadriceps]